MKHYIRISLALTLFSFALVPSAWGKQIPGPATQIVILTPEQREILSHMSIVFLDDGLGGTVKTIRLTGVNWQIVNGSGTTDGAPDGVGNLVR